MIMRRKKKSTLLDRSRVLLEPEILKLLHNSIPCVSIIIIWKDIYYFYVFLKCLICDRILIIYCQYIYIYIYSHPQTDCFVLSQLFSVARHAGFFKLGSKPT